MRKHEQEVIDRVAEVAEGFKEGMYSLEALKLAAKLAYQTGRVDILAEEKERLECQTTQKDASSATNQS